MSHRKLLFSGRMFVFSILILVMLSTSTIGSSALGKLSAPDATANALGNYAIVFVSRGLSAQGSVYYPAGGIMPGVSGYSHFQVAAPGKLIVREANGTLRTLIDGSNPTAASFNLIDVNAPDVSYDGTKIVFAGIVAGNYQMGPVTTPGAWRIYIINVDGTGLRQVTFSDRNINLAQFGNNGALFTKYDDSDPAWLPDGRIVFSSTRWPSFGMYGGVRTTNLHVVNADGTGMHRITAERNGADRPVVDPLTGKIIYSRWWRNFRTATDSMATLPSPNGGYIMKDGLCAINHTGAECQEVGGASNLDRNAWHLASINPDGTGLVQFAGRSNTFFTGEVANHAYGGAFAPDGSFYANFFPMTNGTEAAGFGGIRHFPRGANGYTPIIGVTTRDESIQQFVSTNPNSFGVYVGNYAADPVVLPDGSLLISWAVDVAQDYGLYTINADGSGRALVYDSPGTTELRAKLILPRALPPIIPDQITQVASALPPLAGGPYDIDGTFQFQALNVYFNAPVDTNIMSAPPVGSANTIRFFIDHQRSQQSGSHEEYDFPILLKEVLINPNGSITADLPANVPLFEQIRTSNATGYKVPFPAGVLLPSDAPGATHVAGENFGRPNVPAKCVGCHAGHTMIPVPDNPADAQWTNLAPGATVTSSSLSTGLRNGNGAVDRKVKLKLPYNNYTRYWFSQSGQNPNQQWLQLTFPVPVTVRTVRLYNIPSTESSIKVLNTSVRLYFDAAATQQVASATSGVLSENGTDIAFHDVPVRSIRIYFTSVNGSVAGLGEVEVIARGESDIPSSVISGNTGVPGTLLSLSNGGQAVAGANGSYSISVPIGWSGIITPTLAGVTFDPPNRSYTNITNNQTDQDYAAWVTLSGNTGIAGVTLNYVDGTPKSVITNSSGNYSFTVPYGWSGIVTPSRTGFTFVPASNSYTSLGTSRIDQNYLASWVGGVKVESDRNVVAVGRPHIGSEVLTYNGFASGSLNAYVPMLFKDAFGGSYDSALYVQNVDPVNNASITLKFHDANGNLTCSHNDTLTPLASKGYWLPSIGCLGSSWVGGVKVEADHDIVAVGRSHLGSEVLTYNGFSSGSPTAFVPMLFKDAFDGSYDSALYVQNVDPSNTATVKIHFYDSDGVETHVLDDTLAPLASKGYWLPGISALGSSWVGGVKVEADHDIVAVGRPHLGAQILAYDGFSEGNLNTYASMLFKDAFGGSYDSALYVQNVDASNTANITLKFYNASGSLTCSQTDTIAPLASKGYWLPSIGCLGSSWVGGVKVESDQNIVTVGRPHVGTQIMAYDDFAVGNLNFYLPMLFRDGFGGSYDSALYLQNLDGSNPANITIKLYDAGGNLACTLTDTLSALASKGYWLPSFTCTP